MRSLKSMQQSDSRRWTIAIVLALLLHGFALIVLELTRPFSADSAQASPPTPIDLVFAAQTPESAADAARPREEPAFFSELPEDRADARPEQADFLSNVDSRARDRATAGPETQLPRLEGESEAPHVGFEPQAGSTTPPSESPAPPGEESSSPTSTEDSAAQPAEEAVGEVSDQGERVGEQETGSPRDPTLSGRPARDPREELLRSSPPPEPQAPRYRLGAGSQDLFQEEMNNRLGNVSLFGDVSLNTIAWAWAPWLQRFARDFHRNWFPPYAYLLGIIHGHDVVEIEVAKDGALLRLDLLEAEGHESLAQASEATFRAMAPFQPLPPDFPEETLILRVKLIYPKHR